MRYLSAAIETIAGRDTPSAMPNMNSNPKCLNDMKLGPNEEMIRSETARLATRYVAEFLKHFSGSLINAIKSSICRTIPNTPMIWTCIYFNERFDILDTYWRWPVLALRTEDILKKILLKHCYLHVQYYARDENRNNSAKSIGPLFFIKKHRLITVYACMLTI